jgi:hypothetical protein
MSECQQRATRRLVGWRFSSCLSVSDRTRSDTSPLSGESMYAFLDRVAGLVWNRICKLIEDWLNGYCLTDQAEIAERLHSKETSTS